MRQRGQLSTPSWTDCRGGKKTKPAFSIFVPEIGGVVNKEMKRLKTMDKRRLGERVGRYAAVYLAAHSTLTLLHARGVRADRSGNLSIEEGDEEGGAWQSAMRKDNIITHLQGGVEQLNEELGKGAKLALKWIPGVNKITEVERRQVRAASLCVGSIHPFTPPHSPLPFLLSACAGGAA